jgi:hypothetical protein
MENYFNYFTEIEEHFQRARGTGMFLISSLDWALIETWKEANIPLEAVLRGIDRSFEKYQKRKRGTRKVNGLAYCTQEVLAVAAEASAPAAAQKKPVEAPFSPEELAKHFSNCAAKVRGRFPEIAVSLDELAASEHPDLRSLDLEDLERRLTNYEEKIFAGLMVDASDADLLEIRREMDRQLAAHRRTMPAAHLALVEKQFIQKKLLERGNLPRLSLFYL